MNEQARMNVKRGYPSGYDVTWDWDDMDKSIIPFGLEGISFNISFYVDGNTAVKYDDKEVIAEYLEGQPYHTHKFFNDYVTPQQEVKALEFLKRAIERMIDNIYTETNI